MFGLLKKDVSGAGTVYFRGNIPPRAEEFEYLRASGWDVSRLPDSAGAHWALKVRHREWGEAEVVCLRDLPRLSDAIIDLSGSLSGAEKETAKSAGPGVSVKAPATKKYVLRDRKNLLRILRALMGEDGVLAADHQSQLLWSREMLDEELSHDADLDVQSITCFHAVKLDGWEEREERQKVWLHSHGLAELGAFDFDILEPSEDALSSGDTLRSVSLAVLEGTLKGDMPGLALGQPGPVVRTVPAEVFQRLGEPEHTAIRDDDGTHAKNRSVLCEPEGRGLLSRFKSKRPRPNRFLSSKFPQPMMMLFSDAATDLMAERARATFPLFREMHGELSRLGLTSIVKLGLPADDGDGHEHMWFEVHEVGPGEVDATLLNEPFAVSRFKQGDRARHSLELLTEWLIQTPVGPINPRTQSAARVLRENPGVMAALKEMMAGSEDPL